MMQGYTGVVGTPASGGGGAVDLSAYVTTTAMNTAIQNFIEVGDITVQTGAASGGGSLSYNNGQFTFNPAVTTDLTGYATETYVDDSIATLTGGVTIPSDINDLTDADGLLNTDINELSDADGLLNSGGSSIAAAPKQIAAGLTTGLTSIANIENGEVLVTWIAGYQQNNNSETMTVYDQNGYGGANPTSTVLATGTNTVKWVNNTGSTVSVHIYATATSTGSSVRVVAMHFGADASTQAAGQIVGGTFTTSMPAGTTTISLGSNIAGKQVLVQETRKINTAIYTANSSGEIDVVHGSSSDPETWYWQAVI